MCALWRWEEEKREETQEAGPGYFFFFCDIIKGKATGKEKSGSKQAGRSPGEELPTPS